MVGRLDGLSHHRSDLDVKSNREADFLGDEIQLQEVEGKEQTHAVFVKGTFSACGHLPRVLCLSRPK